MPLEPSAAPQNEVVGQERDTAGNPENEVQVPPAGDVDQMEPLRAEPSPEATHCVVFGAQDTVNSAAPDIVGLVTFQGPPVGLVEVTTSPPPTATQSAVVGQDTPFSWLVPSASTVVHTGLELVGWVVVAISPFAPTATQSETEGHETPYRVGGVVPLPAVASFHADGPPFGLVELTTDPNSPTATHSEAFGHEMLLSLDAMNPFGGLTSVGVPHLRDRVGAGTGSTDATFDQIAT